MVDYYQKDLVVRPSVRTAVRSLSLRTWASSHRASRAWRRAARRAVRGARRRRRWSDGVRLWGKEFKFNWLKKKRTFFFPSTLLVVDEVMIVWDDQKCIFQDNFNKQRKKVKTNCLNCRLNLLDTLECCEEIAHPIQRRKLPINCSNYKWYMAYPTVWWGVVSWHHAPPGGGVEYCSSFSTSSRKGLNGGL